MWKPFLMRSWSSLVKLVLWQVSTAYLELWLEVHHKFVGLKVRNIFEQILCKSRKGNSQKVNMFCRPEIEDPQELAPLVEDYTILWYQSLPFVCKHDGEPVSCSNRIWVEEDSIVIQDVTKLLEELLTKLLAGCQDQEILVFIFVAVVLSEVENNEGLSHSWQYFRQRTF